MIDSIAWIVLAAVLIDLTLNYALRNDLQRFIKRYRRKTSRVVSVAKVSASDDQAKAVKDDDVRYLRRSLFVATPDQQDVILDFLHQRRLMERKSSFDAKWAGNLLRADPGFKWLVDGVGRVSDRVFDAWLDRFLDNRIDEKPWVAYQVTRCRTRGIYFTKKVGRRSRHPQLSAASAST